MKYLSLVRSNSCWGVVWGGVQEVKNRLINWVQGSWWQKLLRMQVMNKSETGDQAQTSEAY